MDIFDKIRSINLPDNSFVIVGGGVLVALGLIDWDDDIDITVTAEIFDDFLTAGWQQEKWQDKTVLKYDIYDLGVGFGGWNLEQLMEDALWIKGYPFISLDKLRKWKLDMGRQKDLNHVIIIERYLSDNSK